MNIFIRIHIYHAQRFSNALTHIHIYIHVYIHVYIHEHV
jgi:hypothetical protein